MKKYARFITIGLVSIALSGCAVKTRVLEVERVDQKVYGNAGFIYGEVPQELKREKKPKTREIFEIDISEYTDKELRASCGR